MTDFARAICEALLMVVGTAMTLIIVAGYAIYVVILYWWRQLLVVAGVALLAWLVL